MAALHQKLEELRDKHSPKPKVETKYRSADLAWRMVIELTAGIVIGFVIGYGLDALFGTMPLFLVIFIGFGLAGGIRTMMRTAAEVQKMQEAAAYDEQAAREKEGHDLGR